MLQIKRWITSLALMTIICSCSVLNKETNSNTEHEVNEVFKTNFENTSKSKLLALSHTDGFFGNDSLAINIPEQYQNVEKALRGIGLGEYPNEVIESMNRVAEKATKEVFPSLIKQINEWSNEEIEQIRNSAGEHPATDYLRKETSSKIRKKLKSIIPNLIESEWLSSSWDKMFEKYNQIPFILGKENEDLTSYISNCTIEATYKTIMIAEEEVKK